MAMPMKIVVPINTMLADLDESLKNLLKRDLERHGFDGVEIEFDAPDKEWAASLSSPAVNLFLYDIREAKELRPIEWQEQVREGRTTDLRPPLRIDASYAVTAWTRDVQDEHRLLSQAMAIFYAFPVLPEEILAASLANGSQRYPLKTTTAQERHEDASDFWTAVGGQYKASFNYVVTLSCESGVSLERGPEVKTATTRLFDRDARNATLLEMHRSGGNVVDADGDAGPERLGAPPGDRAARGHGSRRPVPLRPAPLRELHGRRARPRRQGAESRARDSGPGRGDRPRRRREGRRQARLTSRPRGACPNRARTLPLRCTGASGALVREKPEFRPCLDGP